MVAILIRWLASALTLVILANTVTGIRVEGAGAAFTAVVVLAVGNLLLQPFVKAISTAGCLINLLTLGLFEAVIHFIFWILAFSLVGDWLRLVEGFQVDGIGPAAVGATALTVVNAVLSPFLKKDKDDRRKERERRA